MLLERAGQRIGEKAEGRGLCVRARGALMCMSISFHKNHRIKS